MKRTVEVEVEVIDPAQKKFNVTIHILFNVLLCLIVTWISWDWFDMYQPTAPIPWGIALIPGITFGSVMIGSGYAISDYFENKKHFESMK